MYDNTGNYTMSMKSYARLKKTEKYNPGWKVETDFLSGVCVVEIIVIVFFGRLFLVP